jgi:hypothetical protein
MRSQGTKETQGINGDAARLQRKQHAALAFVTDDGDPCPYPHHRITDWRLTLDHVNVVCGVCHPPAKGLHVARVAA